MKKTVFLGLLAIILSFSLISCEVEISTDHFLNGTWVGIVGFMSTSGCPDAPNCEHNGTCHGFYAYEGEYTFNNGNWEFFSKANFIFNMKGTFITNSEEIIMTITHYCGTRFELDQKLLSKNEVETALRSSGEYTDDWILSLLSVFTTFTMGYTVDGDTLTLIINKFGDVLILQRK